MRGVAISFQLRSIRRLASSTLVTALKPREVVEALDQHIVGQAEAKKAVAIALRNRWRRHQLPEDLRGEVIPKNILMIGPTGCGKTEIARRMAKLTQAPFIKVEATKFTEVGFHGKDVDQIIRDLVDISMNMTKKRFRDEFKEQARANVDKILVDTIIGENSEEEKRKTTLEKLVSGELDEHYVDIDVPPRSGDKANPEVNIPTALFESLQRISRDDRGRKAERRRVTVADARLILEETELDKLVGKVWSIGHLGADVL